ncbi:HORMA domain-containing protein [Melampsora americana]|nr:HORMA domain-containing protein [Melampsora americana]
MPIQTFPQSKLKQITKTKTSTSMTVKSSSDVQLVTSTQSLSIVKTLVQTGIGVITYLRGIFPDECFNDDRIGPDRSNEIGNSNSENFQKNGREGRGYIRVKKIKPGVSKESDQVLDYLDEGVMDAIQRGYLRQLLFAMYLDPDKPRDVIECYTFNFTYSHSNSGNPRLVPEMEVRDQLKEMSLTGKVTISGDLDSNLPGKTGGMVKRQIQTLIKNLICSTQSLSDINGRRFLSFKLYYNERVPLDYEPPHFSAADLEKDRFTFGTAGKEEVPSATEMGKVDTGFHTVRVALASISDFLPVNDLRGKTTHKENESQVLNEQIKSVKEEAKQRPIVWDTEKVLEPLSTPPDITGIDDGVNENEKLEPLGFRDPNGKILPLPDQTRSTLKSLDHEPDRPVKILETKAYANRDRDNEDLAPESSATEIATQLDQNSQSSPSASRAVQKIRIIDQVPTKDPVDLYPSMDVETPNLVMNDKAQALGFENGRSRAIPNKNILVLDSQHQDVSSRDLDEHLITNSGQLRSVVGTRTSSTALEDKTKQARKDNLPDDPIQPFTKSHPLAIDVHDLVAPSLPEDPIEDCDPTDLITEKSRVRPICEADKEIHAKKKIKSHEIALDAGPDGICECKDWHDDIAMIMCERCSRWRHLSCYGYKSIKDTRIPSRFECFRCQIHGNLSLEETWKREDEIKTSLEGLRTLCVFRRTLQIIYDEGMPNAIKTLANRLEIDVMTASQVKKRLIAERYLYVKSTTPSKPSGILESEISTQRGRPRGNTKGRGKKVSKPEKIQMRVNETYEQKRLKEEVYFTPGSELESKLLNSFRSNSSSKIKETDQPQRSSKSNQNSEKIDEDPMSDQIESRTRSWTHQVEEEPERIEMIESNRDTEMKDGSETPIRSSIVAKPILTPNLNLLGSRGGLRESTLDKTFKSISQLGEPIKRKSIINQTPRSSKKKDSIDRMKRKNKVSIGVKDLEVPGVSWDDFSE